MPAAVSGVRVERLGVRARPAAADLYVTGYDASAHTSEETIKAAVPCARHGHVGGLVGTLRLPVPGGFRADDPEHGRCGQQGWNVFFWAFDQRVSSGVKEFVYLIVFVSQLLCGLATSRPPRA